MSELPEGWALATVDELAETSLGKMLDAKQQTGQYPTPYLRNINVRWGSFDLSDVAEMDVAPHELDRVLAQPGDVIACEGGEPGRAAVWRGEPIAIQKALHRIRPAAGISPDYLAYVLRATASTKQLDRLFTGTTIKHLPQEKLRKVQVALAPKPEQERIVAAIEEAFSKLDAGEAGLRTVRQLLKRMRDAILTAAVTGRLVPQDPTDTPATKLLADARADEIAVPAGESIPGGWAWALLGSVAAIGGGIQKQPKRSPIRNRVPFLRVANVSRGRLDLSEVHEIELFDGELDRYGLVAGDLLVVEGNGSPDQIGRSALWRGEISPCVHQNHLIRVRPGSVLEPAFLELYWNSPSAARRVQALASSTSGLHTLSTGKLKTLPVVVPPPSEQLRIVTEVERQLSFVDACERAVDAGLARSAALRRSVLKAAFEGRLVLQDPSDEPASVLLERIRAERAAVPGQQGKRRKKAEAS
jgi:type I restriction enzyme S subunit